MSLSSRRLFLPLLTAAATASPVWAAPRQIPVSSSADAVAQSAATSQPAPAPAPSSGNLALTLRRTNGAVEVVVQGTGAAPMLQQRAGAGLWQGQLNLAQPNGLRYGPQRMSLPEAGLQSVSINGSGNSYQLEVTSMPGLPLGRPVVSADGVNLVISFPAAAGVGQQNASLNLRQPGSVPQPTFAPPLQPRAVAPPLGDMAVGSMVLRNQSFVNVPGPNVTLTLRNAPAKDALMAIAQLGGYGFVYVDEPASASSGADQAASTARPVTIAFRNERYAQALNSVLLSAGLQGRLEGRMILAGPNVLGKAFGSQVSKVYRLNQASAASAADYLASLGASITKVSVITNSVTQGNTQSEAIQGGPASQQTQTQKITTTETYGAAVGPLKGLIGTTDSRLQTVTLIGSSQLVSVAENYLRQIDLRQRQVALSVKILDVSLDNNTDIANSFAFRWGNNLIVNDNGTLGAVFGSQYPGAITGGTVSPITSGSSTAAFDYTKNNFLDFLKATIESSSTKVLASPTLILQENADIVRADDGGGGSGAAAGGTDQTTADAYSIDDPIGRRRGNEALVRVGTNVPTDVSSTQVANSGTNTCTIGSFATAGLVLGARVQRIDDNGFVTFSLSPSVSAVVKEIPVGERNSCPPISILSIRRLDTGVLRVRSGQTLILTGVISDFDRQEVSKWPILGDIPLVGQFFRSSGSKREKRELVIMVTPRIVDDNQGGVYGYGYNPSSREMSRMVGESL